MMSWEQLLKTDPCTLEAKEILYQVLEKMGANNDLLESLRTHADDDIREMLEDFARTSPQKDVFKALLRNWDMCIVETRKNPNTPQVEMDSSGMYKILKGGKTTDRQSLKDAITVTTEKLNYESNARLASVDRKQETAIFVKTDDRFYDTLREEYIKHYMENMQVERRYIGSVKNHAKAKIQPISIRSMVGKYLRTLGYEYMVGNDRLWRKIK